MAGLSLHDAASYRLWVESRSKRRSNQVRMSRITTGEATIRWRPPGAARKRVSALDYDHVTSTRIEKEPKVP